MLGRYSIFISLFFSLSLRGQKTVLPGRIVDESSKESIPFAELKILKADSVIYRTTSDMDGVFTFSNIASGQYDISIQYVGYRPKILKNIICGSNTNDSLKIQLATCEFPAIRPCTICNRSDKVIYINSSLDFHYSFGSKRKERKYYKIINDRGYMTAEVDGKTVLTDILKKADNDRIKQCQPCCDLLFCERDKVVF